MQSIIEEQYILARKINIGPEISNLMPDFERQIFINLLIREMEEEEKRLKQKTGK